MKLKELLLLMMISPVTMAAPSTFDLINPYGMALGNNLTALDWAESGSGVVVNQPDPLAVGTVLEFRFQTKLSGMTPQDNTTIPGATGLILPFASGGYEFTVVSTFQFVVTNVVGNTYSYDSIDGSGYAKIFYDDINQAGKKANTSNGTGFDDGLLVAELTVAGHDGITGAGHATYTQTSDNPLDGGVGASKLKFDVSSPGDFINPSIFNVSSSIMDYMMFDSNQNRPAGTSDTEIVNGHIVNNTTDVLLKVDGSSQMFIRSIPEPGILTLLSIGLIGFIRKFV